MVKSITKVAVVILLILVVGGLIFLSPPKEVTKTKTKIGFLPITDHLILGISKEKDNTTFKNVELETIKFSDWATISEALISGSLDGAFLLAPLAYQTKLKDAPVKIVLLGHRDGSALIVKVKDNINSVQDLNGTTIAIPHRFSTHNMLLHLYTTNAGLRYGVDFKTIEMAPPEMPAALSRGDIDGYIVAEPFGAKGELLGVGKVLVLSNQICEHHPDCVFVVREEYLNAHPEAMDELTISLIQSGIFAEQNRDEAAKIGTRFLGQPENALLKALKEPKERVTFYDLMPKKEEFIRLQDYMADKMGLFPQKVTLDELIDTSFAQR